MFIKIMQLLLLQSHSLKEWVFVNLALKIQCHVVRNTLLKTSFSPFHELDLDARKVPYTYTAGVMSRAL